MELADRHAAARWQGGPRLPPRSSSGHNGDPVSSSHGEAIKVLGKHFGLTLDPVRCYPYKRG